MTEDGEVTMLEFVALGIGRIFTELAEALSDVEMEEDVAAAIPLGLFQAEHYLKKAWVRYVMDQAEKGVEWHRARPEWRYQMLGRIKAELARYEGMWILPDDLDALVEIIAGAAMVAGLGEWILTGAPDVEYNLGPGPGREETDGGSG